MSRSLFVVTLLLGCGDPPETARQADASNGSCSADCLEGWWTTATGQCSTFCSLSPAPAECSEADCSAASFYVLNFPEHSYQLYTAIVSESGRSFTAFARTPGTWAVPTECHLTLNQSSDPQGSIFACSSMSVDLPARDWQRPSLALEAVLPSSSEMLPVHRSY
jgi:hypothetical protein